MPTKLDIALGLAGQAGASPERAGQQVGAAQVMYGTALADSTGTAPDMSVRVHLDTSEEGTEATFGCDAPISKGDRVAVVWQGGRYKVVALAGIARTQAKQQQDMDGYADAIAKQDATIAQAKADTEQARKDAAAASQRADELAGEITDVKVTVTDQGKRIDGAVTKADESLKASTETKQTVKEVSAKATQAYESSQDALTKSAEAVVTANGVKSTVEQDYLSKADASETYSTKSQLQQTADSINSRVGDVSTKADSALTRVSSVEQTAEGLSTRITSVASLAGAANLAQGFCAPPSRWAALDSRWQTADGVWDSVGSSGGWAYLNTARAGDSDIYVNAFDLPCDAILPGKSYTLLVEWSGVKLSGTATVYGGSSNADLKSQFVAAKGAAIKAGDGSARLSLTSADAATLAKAGTCLRLFIEVKAGGSVSGDFRYSLYFGSYDGAYKPPAGTEAANDETAARTTLIRQTSKGVDVGYTDTTGQRLGPYCLVNAAGSFDINEADGSLMARFGAAQNGFVTLYSGPSLTIRSNSEYGNVYVFNSSPNMIPNADSGQSDIAEGIVMGAMLLYDNPAGTKGAGSLLRSLGYFTFVELLYTDGTRKYASRFSPRGTSAQTSISRTVSSGQTIYVGCATVSFDAASFNVTGNCQYIFAPGASPQYDAGQPLAVTRVIGWR